MCNFSQLLDRYKNTDPKRMNELVAGQETWIYFHELEVKKIRGFFACFVALRPKSTAMVMVGRCKTRGPQGPEALT